MRRGTTPTNTFTVDVDLTQAEALFVTYRQNHRTVIEKSLEDVTLTENTVTVDLEQTDTLKFGKGEVEMQIRAKLPDGSALASQIMIASVEEVLKDGVI